MESAPKTRMSATERRAQVLAAATKAFAHGGYHGTTTDAVAQEAGVSQPYVVRMFGSKATLFREVFARAVERVTAEFEPTLAKLGEDPTNEQLWEEMGQAYTDLLLGDRDLLLVMMHGFAAGSDPEIGAQARTWMTRIYTDLRDRSGATPEQVRSFIASGMLLNTLVAMEAPQHLQDDPDLAELAACAFGDDLDAAVRARA
ncbi:MAG TPA: TetR/AcrR family transcriptional regulator [Nocardioidaceae bacterium]|nr:TetR/AcrR family transcriptional regulator [Nocardioidaceae bacterium]